MIRRHVSAEDIARYSEGDISGRKATRIRSHLAGCRQCAAVREDLARVPALLASAEAPPMPEHLAARIQAALSTESAQRASRDARPASAPPHRRAAGRSWPWIPGISPRAAGWAASATAAVLLAGGGAYYLIASGPGNGGASSGSASAPSSSIHRTAAGANVPAAPALRGAGPHLEYQRAGQPTAFTPVATAKNYVPDRLAAQVRTTLAEFGALATSTGPGQAAPLATPSSGPNRSSGQPPRIGGFSASALEGCVSRVSAGAEVVLVDVASYQSSPAAVIVTQGTSQSPRKVWVVGPGCSASISDLLHTTTLPAGG